MDFETISKMKIDELKRFLKLQLNLRVSGRKFELIARVFCAIENNVKIAQTAEEIEGVLAGEYKDKLVCKGFQIPDPFKLKEGWKPEREGIKHYPSVSTYYIIQFLMLNYDMEDLNDYKKSKAYSYFERGWLGKIDFHPLRNTPFCLLKTDCRPSQKISDTLHKLWLLLSKDTGNVLEALRHLQNKM